MGRRPPVAMNRHPSPILAALAVLVAAAAAHAAEPVRLTVKAVKETASRCSAPPALRILKGGDDWRLHPGPTWEGENEREVFFTIESGRKDALLPRLAMICPGAQVARVLVGHTDVKFERADERFEFDAVADRANGTLINNSLPDPLGDGLPIGLYHNWRIRAGGPYEGKPYPEAETRAVINYLLGAREALRLMGGMGPGDGYAFDGRITLLSFEVACGRAHDDSPPHVHIMLYVPGYTPGSQVPHFYMDPRGRIVRNAFAELGVPGSKRSRDYGPGDVCQLLDLRGRLALECVITPEGGLILRKNPGAPGYLLIGDETVGPGEKVWVTRGGARLVACTSCDDAAAGVLTATVERFEGDRGVRRVTQTMRYDPFNARVLEVRREIDPPVPGDDPARVQIAPAGTDNPRNSEAAIVSLRDGSLLLGWTEFYGPSGADHAPARICGRTSRDGGRTWDKRRVLVENDGGCNVMEVNFLRLKSGALALFHCRKDTQRTDCRVMMRVSADEGATWGPARQLSPAGKYTGLTNGRSLRLRSGRILLETWEGGSSFCLLSDDDGASWREGARVKPARGCWEPACVELKDGRVLMLMRTGMGGQYASVSADGGETWSAPSPTPLVGTAAPVSLSRIPGTGDLLAIWNHNPGAPRRNPLTSAVSRDEGATWTQFRNIEDTPGDAWAYPAVTWVKDEALVTYFSYTGGLSLHLRRIPRAWFYP